ncbi:MAG TPA: hypothetical protein VKE25_00070 [Actinomycetes bacterium]|nr:hypothetical protein [Actinomycetes bacterium]
MGPYVGQVLTDIFTNEDAAHRPTGRHRRPKARAMHRSAEAASASAPRSGILSRWLHGLAPAQRSWRRQPDAQ